jgi:UDP:flavonoid glycosyltransferase YjiC (YdhE family)
VLLTTGRDAERATLGALPANVHVERWVAQEDILGHAAGVVCHGGSGTTFGALTAGVPLVVVPLFADQSANGRVIEGAGAGLLVASADAGEGIAGPGPGDVASIRAAIGRVLADPSYRRAAERISDEMARGEAIDDVLASLAA